MTKILLAIILMLSLSQLGSCTKIAITKSPTIAAFSHKVVIKNASGQELVKAEIWTFKWGEVYQDFVVSYFSEGLYN